jgi:hypothetical protein
VGIELIDAELVRQIASGNDREAKLFRCMVGDQGVKKQKLTFPSAAKADGD